MTVKVTKYPYPGHGCCTCAYSIRTFGEVLAGLTADTSEILIYVYTITYDLTLAMNMSPLRNSITCLLSLISYGPLLGQNTYTADLAQRVVKQAADVRKGEQVVIFGGIHSLPIATEISKACADANALPVIVMTNDSLENLRLTDSLDFGIKYVNRITKIMEQARVLIVLSPVVHNPLFVTQNSTAFPYHYMEEYNARIRLLAQHPGVRVVYVNVATKPVADLLHVKFEDYESMLQQANMVDTELMDANINRLSGLLKNAGKVRITNPMGTDISFLINNRQAIINDGKITRLEAQASSAYNRTVTLPVGILRISVIEGSGMGRVVIPESECNYQAIQQISFKINKGKIEQWNAASGGTCFSDILRSNSLNWQVGSIGFSFNWEIKTIDDDGLRFWREDGGGLIWITLGGNEDLGGRVSNEIRQFSFPIQRSTVEIDDKVVLKSSF